MSDSALPVVILGGYLGAGKTTLLNRLLQQQHGLRLAVIVNDFGAINVDAALVEQSDGETIALTNGCICCGIAGGFVQVMYRLRELAARLDGVVVETSGVADPAQAAAYATLPGFRPAAILVLADAERVRQQASDRLIGPTIQRQLKAADLVIVTKGDLAGPERTAATLAWLKAGWPDARLLTTPAAEAPVQLLFDLLAAEGQQSRRLATGVDTQAHTHEDQYVRATACPARPIAEAELRRWYAALPDGILRIKGWVPLLELGGALVLVQGVGRRLELQPAVPVPPEGAVLVFISLSGSLEGVVAPDGSPLEPSTDL